MEGVCYLVIDVILRLVEKFQEIEKNARIIIVSVSLESVKTLGVKTRRRYDFPRHLQECIVGRQ